LDHDESPCDGGEGKGSGQRDDSVRLDALKLGPLVPDLVQVVAQQDEMTPVGQNHHAGFIFITARGFQEGSVNKLERAFGFMPVFLKRMVKAASLWRLACLRPSLP
jgi:hypothetical protein